VISARRPFSVLFRHFLGGFLDNDLIAPAGDLHGPLSKAVAVLALVGLLYPFKLLGTYGRPFWDYASLDAVSWNDKSTFVLISLVVTALLTVIEWDTLRLDRRDCLALGALPIRTGTILRAKLAALGTFLLALSAPLTLVGGLTFPIIMHAGWRSGVRLAAATMAGHLVATLAAAWFAFFTLLAAQSLLQCIPGRGLARRLAAVLQLTATLGLVLALLMLPFIASSTAALKHASTGAGGFAPQMWFVGMYQVIAGQGDADWARLAARGWLALLLSALASAGASLLAYRRALRSAIENVETAGGGRSPAIRLVGLVSRVIARNPSERGFFSFSVLTILRSPWHRLVMAVSAGVALALAMVTLDAATMAHDGVGRVPMRVSHALAMQWVVLAIVLAGVRVAASAPAELRASWLLRMLESDRPARWMAGFRSAVFVSLVAPAVALMAVAMAWQYNWHTIWTLGLAAGLFAGAGFEVLFLGFGRVPFACPAEQEMGDARIRGPLMVALFTILVVPLAELVTLALRTGAGTAAVLASGLAAIALLRWRGRVAIASTGGLSFEPEYRGTQALGIQP
jgi:hypothetical protein